MDKFVNEVFALAETDAIQQEARELIRNYKGSSVELKESDIFSIIKASYIAERFFGKSRFWISQKINHNLKNGRREDFTEEEWQILKRAIATIANELEELADNMRLFFAARCARRTVLHIKQKFINFAGDLTFKFIRKDE